MHGHSPLLHHDATAQSRRRRLPLNPQPQSAVQKKIQYFATVQQYPSQSLSFFTINLDLHASDAMRYVCACRIICHFKIAVIKYMKPNRPLDAWLYFDEIIITYFIIIRTPTAISRPKIDIPNVYIPILDRAMNWIITSAIRRINPNLTTITCAILVVFADHHSSPFSAARALEPRSIISGAIFACGGASEKEA